MTTFKYEYTSELWSEYNFSGMYNDLLYGLNITNKQILLQIFVSLRKRAHNIYTTTVRLMYVLFEVVILHHIFFFVIVIIIRIYIIFYNIHRKLNTAEIFVRFPYILTNTRRTWFTDFCEKWRKVTSWQQQ